MEKENNYGAGLYQDGVFYFTNPGLYKGKDEEGKTTTDWSCLWNNKEYKFKGNTTVPLIIANEPPENIQKIRKLFAKKYAQAVFHQSKRYQDLVKKGGYIPATYNEDSENGEYTKTIQMCLTPLPKSSIEVKDLPKESDDIYKGTKAVKPGQDLNSMFQDYEVPELGQM